MRYGCDHGHYPILALSRKLCYLLQTIRDAFSFEIICDLPGSQIILFFPLSFFLQVHSLYSYSTVKVCMSISRSLLVKGLHLKLVGASECFFLKSVLEEVMQATCWTWMGGRGTLDEKMWSWTLKACKVENKGEYDTNETNYFSLPVSFKFPSALMLLRGMYLSFLCIVFFPFLQTNSLTRTKPCMSWYWQVVGQCVIPVTSCSSSGVFTLSMKYCYRKLKDYITEILVSYGISW